MTTLNFQLREMLVADWPAVRDIYLQGIASGHATFETTAPEFDVWDSNHLKVARLVLISDDQVAGWAALSKVSARQVYAGVAEVSVYVATEFRRKGFGETLLRALIEAAERNGIWTLQASIFPENTGSIQIHNRCGFREVGRRERIAKLNGSWRDTVLFERRSSSVGNA